MTAGMRCVLAGVSIGAVFLATVGCHPISGSKSAPPSIVGAWYVSIPQAPFPYHMFIFHADGTVLQSNPDAGDPNSSDSNGLGAWVADGDSIKGKLVEITADRTTRQFVSRGDISFLIKVTGDTFGGDASAAFYDAAGRRIRGPLAATLQGQRVAP